MFIPSYSLVFTALVLIVLVTLVASLLMTLGTIDGQNIWELDMITVYKMAH